jgi:hypothetical protein
MNDDDMTGRVERAFVEEAQTDFVGLWLLVKWVGEDLAHLDAHARRSVTLAIIRSALEGGYVVPGEFENGRFVPWEMPSVETVERIDRAWATLGRGPDIGEIAWFVDPKLLPSFADRNPMGDDWRRA